ncbi:MAG: hypothetical protein WAL71_16785 [Terriglobales bacterium]|jgi:hypothetical protein
MREAVVRETVDRLWPEIQWIDDAKLREQVTQPWIKALERGPAQDRRCETDPSGRVFGATVGPIATLTKWHVAGQKVRTTLVNDFPN